MLCSNRRFFFLNLKVRYYDKIFHCLVTYHPSGEIVVKYKLCTYNLNFIHFVIFSGQGRVVGLNDCSYFLRRCHEKTISKARSVPCLYSFAMKKKKEFSHNFLISKSINIPTGIIPVSNEAFFRKG